KTLDPHITDFYNAYHPSQRMNQFRCSSGSSDPRGGTRMAAVKKKPGTAAPKSKPKLKSTMKKKATKKPTKKKKVKQAFAFRRPVTPPKGILEDKDRASC